MTVGTKSYAPVRINKGQRKELEEIFYLLSEDKKYVMRMTLDVLGWGIIIHPIFGVKLERQS